MVMVIIILLPFDIVTVINSFMTEWIVEIIFLYYDMHNSCLLITMLIIIVTSLSESYSRNTSTPLFLSVKDSKCDFYHYNLMLCQPHVFAYI